MAAPAGSGWPPCRSAKAAGAGGGDRRSPENAPTSACGGRPGAGFPRDAEAIADALRAAWPEGVDVALNSRAGRPWNAAPRLMAPSGGSSSSASGISWRTAARPIRPLRRNDLLFRGGCGCAAACPAGTRPGAAGRHRRAAGRGALMPLPHAVFAAGEAESAFRTLQASPHIGQAGDPPTRSARQPSPRPRPGSRKERRTYLLLRRRAGLRAVECAKWRVRRTARRISRWCRAAAAGRRGPRRPLADPRGAGRVYGSRPATPRTPPRWARCWSELRGVRAAALRRGCAMPPPHYRRPDGAAATMDAARFATVLAPKLAVGAEPSMSADARGPAASLPADLLATNGLRQSGPGNYVAANLACGSHGAPPAGGGAAGARRGLGPIADSGVLARDKKPPPPRRWNAAPGVAPMPAQAGARRPARADRLRRAGGVHLARVAWGNLSAALPVLA